MNTTPSTVGAYEAKTKLPELLERAASGEVITITKHDHPMAKLIPANQPSHTELAALFEQMDEIRKHSVLNRRGRKRLSVKQLIEEGRK